MTARIVPYRVLALATLARWLVNDAFAPSYRRADAGWIDAAKREETRERRLGEAVSRFAKGEKLGLK